MASQQRTLVGAALFAGALICYNNLRPGLGGADYVGVNLLVGAVVGLSAIVLFDSNFRELGLTRNRSMFVVVTGAAAVVLVTPLFLLAAFEATARWIADDRAAGLSGSEVAWHALIRIPLGTALFEEFAFRGALFGILSRRGYLFGAVTSSVAFGLWHIRPALGVIDANDPEAGAALAAMWVAGVVVITTAAGMGFCWLRIKGRGLAAPMAFHALVNSLSLIAAALAHRQLG